MTRLHLLPLLGGLLLGLAVSGGLPRFAQGQARKPQAVTPGASEPARPEVTERRAQGIENPAGGAVAVEPPGPRASIQDALLRPYHFPFARPTPLSRVCERLGQTLGSPVVLDLAALERLEIKPEEPVQLELSGVRLKTGLKLLLDQRGLTYRIVAEDNLLIITDGQGAEDPIDKIWTELRSLHRDVHDLQDSVDELLGLTAPEGGEGPRVRKPTIIEEMPEKPADQPARKPAAPDLPAKPSGGSPRRTRTSL